MYFYRPLHTDEQKLDDLLEPINSSSVPIQDVVWKTSQEQWTIETGGERGSGISVLAARYDDDDDIYEDLVDDTDSVCSFKMREQDITNFLKS